MSSPSKNNLRGFTLIELSIVLVVIGLIVGGVLVGQDLIKAAELRATISQLEKFNTATTTFKLKYGSLPGDMSPNTASSLGFYQSTIDCGEYCLYENGSVDIWDAVNEGGIYWRHLSEAKLINGQYKSEEATNEKEFSPEVTFVKNAFWGIANPGYLAVPVSNGKHNYRINNSISPAQAYSIDIKIDDGKPISGKVLELGFADGTWNLTADIGFCTYDGNGSDDNTKYNINPTTGGNNNSCGVYVIQANF